jgi:membrane-associated protein
VDAFLDSIAGSGALWPYLIVAALTFADAFLSLMPNETALTAFAALGISTGSPNVAGLAAAAAGAAILGDAATYLVGRKVGVTRFAWMRSERAVGALGWAQRSLERRAASVILAARYIPFGKFAVSLTAGATRQRFRRYISLVTLSCLVWAVYHTMIGVVFGTWLRANPVLAVVFASVVGIVLGVLIDVLAARRERNRVRSVPVHLPAEDAP